ncbi:glycosyltransferase family 2 protein [Candidatus Pelagibacter sp. RS40]|uniref:glycosyltransferase family 2 protein n=1 Tax=Candidatus Pelagibacter sp. RS40 TaxID=1977865 RepID=UPI000A146B48|nr:glycosyltransferase family 2 protein [Candidatus Pelagibacter sp. RS40]ARJ49515.1 hypothetical protein B8063_05730 [Candidatus Pelagibacter sp. RS40]
MLANITAIILTYNEEKHIKRCILSIKKFVKNIIIIDSFSTDQTLEIAKKFKVKIYKHKFINQAKQINWALKKIKFQTSWILRIDADEYLTKELKKEVKTHINTLNSNYDGISFNRVIKFLNKEIYYGGTSPHKTLRIWKNKKGKCENVWMDEQIIVKGKVFHLNQNLIDENLNDLKWWKLKHRNYAKREAISFLYNKKNKNKSKFEKKLNNVRKSKHLKEKIYYKFPIFVRPLLFFLYSLIFKLGIVTGWQGLVFYYYQTLWFRLLVDINIFKLSWLFRKK